MSAAIKDIPEDSVWNIFTFIGPRSVKRFGSACRAFTSIATEYSMSPEYSMLLVRRAIARISTELVKAHKDCPLVPEKEVLSFRAEAYARKISQILSGSEDPPCDWTEEEVLNFLYPISIGLYKDWRLAPYTLEWCAQRERSILTDGAITAPREEVLALLHKDGLKRLHTIATTNQWRTCTAFITMSTTACETLCPELTDTAGSTMAAYLRVALAENKHILLCLIAYSMTTVELSMAVRRMATTPVPIINRKKAIRDALYHCGTIIDSAPLMDKETKEWIKFVGLGKDSPRTPATLMDAFSCGKSVPGEPKSTPRRFNPEHHFQTWMDMLNRREPNQVEITPDAVATTIHGMAGGAPEAAHRLFDTMMRRTRGATSIEEFRTMLVDGLELRGQPPGINTEAIQTMAIPAIMLPPRPRTTDPAIMLPPAIPRWRHLPARGSIGNMIAAALDERDSDSDSEGSSQSLPLLEIPGNLPISTDDDESEYELPPLFDDE